MTRDEMKKRLLDGFAALFPRLSREEILFASRQSVPEWDSLASITLLTLLQQEFHLDIDLTELDRLASFGDCLAYLEEEVPAEGHSRAI